MSFHPAPSSYYAQILGILCLSGAVGTRAAVPFSSATVTKVENKVQYGDRQGDRTVTRPAVVRDIVRASNFLRSESESRAEIQYPDGTVVRIGQNTVFTFDADSRTLTLEKGSMIFHIPKGAGGGTIKNASLTAAITGTAGKVSANIIAITEGTITLVPSGQEVHAGEFARRNEDGTITVALFDPAQTMAGALVHFNGTMPGFDEARLVAATSASSPAATFNIPDLRALDIMTRTQSNPSTVNVFQGPPAADRPQRNTAVVPPPKNVAKGNKSTNY